MKHSRDSDTLTVDWSISTLVCQFSGLWPISRTEPLNRKTVQNREDIRISTVQ